MAAPGYPQMGPGHMPPMGGPGGPMPPMGPMGGMPRPMRRGTSKIVPVVVSAGLAVGVFCGLLFGLGTGKSDAATEPASGTNVKAKDDTPPPPPPSSAPLKDPEKGPRIAQMGSGSAAGSGSGKPAAPATGSAAGAASGSAAATKPAAPATVKLTVKLDPSSAESTAKITVDGKDITGNSVDLPADKKSVKVAVTAPGYHSQDKVVDLQGGDTTLEMTLLKRATSSGSPGFGGASKPTGGSVPVKPPSGNGSGSGKKPPSGGGLIDI